MKSVIIYNKATTRVIISHLCKSFKEIEIEAVFCNPIEALKYLNHNEVDLVFLDIFLTDITGFDVIQTIKKPPKVILISSDANHALRAFEYCCIVDYLIKPITSERFNKAIEKVKSFMSIANTGNPKAPKTNKEELYLNVDNRFIKIDIEYKMTELPIINH